jgi:hypothetical protein
MPGFVRSKKDEKKWSKAKRTVSSSRSKDENSFSDRDWSLVNHIYQGMNKSSDADKVSILIKALSEFKELMKQRGRWSDFNPEDVEDYGAPSSEEDPYAEENDGEEIDPRIHSVIDPEEWEKQDQGEGEGESESEEDVRDEFEDEPETDEQPEDQPEDEPVFGRTPEQRQAEARYQQEASQPDKPKIKMRREEWDKLPQSLKDQVNVEFDEPAPSASVSEAPAKQIPGESAMENMDWLPDDIKRSLASSPKNVPEQSKVSAVAPLSRPISSIVPEFDPEKIAPEPTMEQLKAMREHTIPWERRAREITALRADPRKNPNVALEGEIIAANRLAGASKTEAVKQLRNSDDFKQASPSRRAIMEEELISEWEKNNPDHLKNQLKAHSEAVGRGEQFKIAHQQTKQKTIQDILRGGATGQETFSVEEGMQHAGGSKDEEGITGGIASDPVHNFAVGNKDFIRDYAEKMARKMSTPSSEEPQEDEISDRKHDIAKILGTSEKHPIIDLIYNAYDKLVRANAKKAILSIGLTPDHPSIKDVGEGLLMAAGMHGLFQAINDYRPSAGASFVTHASNKIRGLQRTALRSLDAIPIELRNALKEFNKKKAQGQVSVPAPAPTTAPSTAESKQPAPSPSTVQPPHKVIGSSTHSKAEDMADRLKRADAQKKVILRKPRE